MFLGVANAAILEPILGILGTFWPSLAYLGPSWSYLGTLLAHLGTILAALSGSWAVLGQLLAALGRVHLKIARDAILSTGISPDDLRPFGTVRVPRHLGGA